MSDYVNSMKHNRYTCGCRTIAYVIEGLSSNVIIDTRQFNQELPMERAFSINPKPHSCPSMASWSL